MISKRIKKTNCRESKNQKIRERKKERENRRRKKKKKERKGEERRKRKKERELVLAGEALSL